MKTLTTKGEVELGDLRVLEEDEIVPSGDVRVLSFYLGDELVKRETEIQG
jgi:hypothetical protein